MGRLFWPVTENDCPVRLTSVTVTGTELEFTTETDALALFPTGTLPRSTTSGDATRVSSWDWVTTLARQPERARHNPEQSGSTNAEDMNLKLRDLTRPMERLSCFTAVIGPKYPRSGRVILVRKKGMGGSPLFEGRSPIASAKPLP
jgi:hypothetical protein